MNLAMNRNRARWAIANCDVARSAQHLKINGPIDLERTVKSSSH